jgi:hypothetical protein
MIGLQMRVSHEEPKPEEENETMYRQKAPQQRA